MVKRKIVLVPVPVHAMQTYRGSRIISPFILHLGTVWSGAVSFRPRPIYPKEKESPLFIEQESLWSPGSVGYFGERKLLPVLVIEPQAIHTIA
jgi:hypothetical protein